MEDNFCSKKTNFEIEKIKIRAKNSLHKKFILSFLCKLFLFLLLFHISKEQEINEITIRVKGRGNSDIYFMDETSENCIGIIIPPDEIQINNDDPIQNPGMIQYLNKEENIVKLKWIDKKNNYFILLIQ